MFAAILSTVGGLAKDWLNNRRETQKEKHEIKSAANKRRAELVAAKGSNDHEWELSTLADNDRFGRRFMMFSIMAPVIVTVVSPALGTAIWASMATVPQPYWAVVGVVIGYFFATKRAPEMLAKFAEALRRPKAE